MTSLRQRLDALSPQQRALLARKLGQRQAERQRGLPRAPRTGSGFPLSFAQERAWLLEQASPRPEGRNRGLWFRAALDPEALRQALEGVVARHEAWRTTFHVVDGRVEQRPGPPPRVAAPVRRRPPSVSEDEHLAQVCHELLSQPFALAEGPLYRFALLETGRPEIYTFVGVFHPILFDAASAGVFLAELTRTYLTRRGGARPEMPPLALQVVDHAVWERQDGERRGRSGHQALRERLEGAPTRRELTAERATRPGGRGGAVALRLEPSLLRSLRALGARSGATLFEVLLSGLVALLSRHGAREALILDVPVSTRGADPELRNLLGCFEDTVPVRVALSGPSGFDALLRRVTEASREALPCTEAPPGLRSDRLDPTRAPAQASLLQARLDLLPALALPEDLGLPVEALGRLGPEGCAGPGSSLVLAEEADRHGATGALVGGLALDPERFDRGTAEGMAQELLSLLERAAASPRTAIVALEGSTC